MPDATEFLVATGDAAPSLNGRVTWIGVTEVENFTSASWMATEPMTTNGLHAVVAIGTGNAAGYVAAACHTPLGWRVLHSLTVIQSALPTIKLQSFKNPERPVGAARGFLNRSLMPPAGRTTCAQAEQEIWSRTIGALGLSVWNKLQSLRWVVLGCGRTGSLVAGSLSRLGVKHLSLIDPDTLESHNVGEMDLVTLDQVGEKKADALASTLRAQAGFQNLPGTPNSLWEQNNPQNALLQVLALSASVSSLSALGAVKEADFLICSVDNPAARLVVAFLAKLYLKPMLDIGTGITLQRERQGRAPARQMGADIRLILPDRCLLCSGGVGNITEAKQGLLSDGSHTSLPSPDAWHRQRAGSLRSLNQIASGMALRTAEDFIAGRTEGSLWLHLEIDQHGIPIIERRRLIPATTCRLCQLGGWGDDGTGKLTDLLRSTSESTGHL